MARGIKIALPGYPADTDTNPDHFALYVDQQVDYVLIKEKVKNVINIGNNSSQQIAHGLPYVPLVMVFAEDTSGVWRRLYSRDIGGWGAYYNIDGTNLTLNNFGTGGAKQFAYHIFLDKITDAAYDIPDLGKHLGFVVAKIGVNAELATDPDDFIFHSDFNTFKIIVNATKSITLAASTNNQSFTQAHNQKFIPLCHAFAKESAYDQVFLPNSGNEYTWGPKAGIVTTGVNFNYVSADITNLTFNFDNQNAATKNITIRYFVLEKVT